MRRHFASLAAHVCTVIAAKRQKGARVWLMRAQRFDRIARGL